MSTQSTAYCRGCTDDYYNGTGSTECWLLKTAQVVTRYRIGWWTAPTEPGAFTKVTTYHCHHEPGRYAYHKALPDYATRPTA